MKSLARNFHFPSIFQLRPASNLVKAASSSVFRVLFQATQASDVELPACHPCRKIGPAVDSQLRAVGENPTPLESPCWRKNEGALRGAIRTPPHASSFFFNDLAFLVIPRKSLKFLTPLFSVPTDRVSLQLKQGSCSFSGELQGADFVTAVTVCAGTGRGSKAHHLGCKNCQRHE